jgi:hypothetical protein
MEMDVNLNEFYLERWVKQMAHVGVMKKTFHCFSFISFCIVFCELEFS